MQKIHDINTAARFYILAAVLICGCLITAVIVAASCRLIYPGADDHLLKISIVVGMIDFLISCPGHYFFGSRKSTTSDIKSYISALPYSLIKNVPDKVSPRICYRWVLQMLLYGVVGFMGGLLGIYATRMSNPESTGTELATSFLSGTFMVYCTGLISWVIERKKKNQEETDNAIAKDNDDEGEDDIQGNRRKYIWSFVFLWGLLIVVCLILLSHKGISAIENVFGYVALCLGFLLSAVLLNIISENFKLKQDIRGKIQLAEYLERESGDMTAENANLNVQKNTLFKEKRELINILCGEYVDKWDSEKMRPLILKRIETEVGKLQSAAFRKTIQKEIEEYYGDIFSEIRERDFLKPDDIYFLQLIIAGFSQKAISFITDVHPKNFYTKKYRISERLQNSDIANRKEVLDLLAKKI